MEKAVLVLSDFISTEFMKLKSGHRLLVMKAKNNYNSLVCVIYGFQNTGSNSQNELHTRVNDNNSQQFFEGYPSGKFQLLTVTVI